MAGVGRDGWPAVPAGTWADTVGLLHLVTQMMGKLRLVWSPMENHYWHVALYPTARGLETPVLTAPGGRVQVELDVVDHRIRITTSDGISRSVALGSRPVSAIYGDFSEALQRIGLDVPIWTRPSEIEDPVPFDEDDRPRSYDEAAARAFGSILLRAEHVFRRFRWGYLGKCSPVHFFWGGCDLALTRFSGRRAPVHPGGVPNLPDRVTRESYSHEVSSCGWWPGGGLVEGPAFYAYAYPEPPGFRQAPVPEGAFYHEDLGEFVLPYEALRASERPDDLLLAFCGSTYRAAADRGQWDVGALERNPSG